MPNGCAQPAIGAAGMTLKEFSMGGGGPAGAAGGGSERRKTASGMRQRQQVVDVRESAISEIRAREAASPLAGMGLGGMGSAARSKMITELQAGGTPVTTIMGGKQVTVGVVGRGMFGDRAYTGRSEFDPIAARAEGREIGEAGKVTGTIMMPSPTGRRSDLPSQARDDATPLVTPEVTPAVTPEVVDVTEGTLISSGTRGRSTRFKRFGGAGGDREGTGVLYG